MVGQLTLNQFTGVQFPPPEPTYCAVRTGVTGSLTEPSIGKSYSG